jgi:hypothetical protein
MAPPATSRLLVHEGCARLLETFQFSLATEQSFTFVFQEYLMYIHALVLVELRAAQQHQQPYSRGLAFEVLFMLS